MKRFSLLLFLTFVFRLASLAQQAVPFENEIRAFEEKDRTSPPPKGAVVFTGSSSIRLWENIESYFPGKTIVQRGFGGSGLNDVIRFADRIILPYQPSQVVLYAGENDIATGTVTAKDVYDRFVTLFNLIRKPLPQTSIVFISMKPSPSRRKYQPIVQEGNRLIKEFLAGQPNTTYVDIYKPMLGANGQPMGDLFRADSLHMTPKGYAIWAEQVRPVLK
ncbi:GDSL-type esterase/lipase family protein [Larkinella soli]|uniref:GDSL-type esterase/lipase family protein n=1 Tax=Larkinella soli TaxID=1770527 RepID=UPI000FFC8887|nr:GDSL-type esterase/lipase family protein [Larkinella soli]